MKRPYELLELIVGFREDCCEGWDDPQHPVNQSHERMLTAIENECRAVLAIIEAFDSSATLEEFHERVKRIVERKLPN